MKTGYESRFTIYDSRALEMLWVKSLHIVFMVTWFAGLFYLPRVFVYHAMTEDEAGRERFKDRLSPLVRKTAP